jgi:hypothetical protein
MDGGWLSDQLVVASSFTKRSLAAASHVVIVSISRGGCGDTDRVARDDRQRDGWLHVVHHELLDRSAGRLAAILVLRLGVSPPGTILLDPIHDEAPNDGC